MTSRSLVAGLGLLLALAVAHPATAQRKELKPGSPAPPISADTWWNADEAHENSIQPGYVYVVEFWATWCGPCRASIPKLHALQENFGPDGLRVLAISTEEYQVVNRFVNSLGKSQMDYSVAVDEKDKTKRAWMDAAELKGIPAAFIVDRTGIVQWIGNPHDPEFVPTVQLVLADRYDSKAFRNTQAKRQAIDEARERRDFRNVERWISEVVEVDPKVFYFLALENVKIKMIDMKDVDGAYEAAAQYAAMYEEDGLALYELARMILSDTELSNDQRRVDFAAGIAEKAAARLDAGDARAHALRAAVAFRQGEYESAVRLQRRAWRMAKPYQKEQFERDLSTYQKARDEARSGM